MKTLKTKDLRLVLDEKTGSISGLFAARSRPVLNFALQLDAFPNDSLRDSYRLANVRILHRAGPRQPWRLSATGFSPDTLSIARKPGGAVEALFDTGSSHDGGMQDLRVRQTFSPASRSGAIKWDITVENPGPCEIEIGELSIPLAFSYSLFGLTVEEMYTSRFIPHPFIAGHSSYVLLQRLNGSRPWLLMAPDDNTPIECMATPHRDVLAHLRFVGGGIRMLYIHSLAARQQQRWKEWFHGHTSTKIPPHGKLTYGFTFSIVNSFDDVENTLLDLGKVIFRASPSMVIPRNTSARVLIKSRKTIHHIRGRGITVRDEGNSLYSLEFRSPGINRLVVNYGKDQWSALVFNVIPGIESLIRSRARFIVENQQVNNRKDERYGAFLMWDAEEHAMVTKAPAPYFYGGSDELGFADPLFLSAKNVAWPDTAEIRALEKYIDNFLFGKLQDPRDYGVVLWYGEDTWHHYRGSDKVRSFNYPHVFNIYHSMYLIGKYYGLTRSRPAIEYLRMAYRTAMAMYTLKMIAGDAYTLGNMGVSRLLDILRSLDEEGMSRERKSLEILMKKSAAYFAYRKHPYGSEFAYDTTGLETVYFFRKYLARSSAKAAATLDTLLAVRHRHPFWCQSGNDVRAGMGNGKFRGGDSDEIAFSYMAPLNSLCILDDVLTSRDPRLMETAYPGVVGCWSLVEKDGTAHNLYTHEPQSMLYDPWTSEMGLALFASLKGMASYLIRDPDLGITPYGCSLKSTSRGITIIPSDGLRRKIIDLVHNISFEAPNGIIEKMTVSDDGRAPAHISPVMPGQKQLIIRANHLKGKPLELALPNGQNIALKKGSGEVILPDPKAESRIAILFDPAR